MTDDELARRAGNGDRDAFAELAARYQNLVWTICRTRISDAGDAQDAAQESLIAAWRFLPGLTTDNFRGWLATITLNKCRDYYRAKARRGELLLLTEEDIPERAAPDSPEEETIRGDEAARLRESVEALPEKYREVVGGYYFEEKSVKQMAAERGLSPKSVETRLYRGIERLRKEHASCTVRQRIR